MEDLSLHVLDVVENSIRAGAKLVEIVLIEDEEADLMTLEIKDDGRGMDSEMLARASDPFFSTKEGRRHGLGLPFLAQSAREADGEFEISSDPGLGTRIRATFRLSHPDRRPVGDMSATLEVLVAGNPEVDFVFEYRSGGTVDRFDTRSVGQP